MTVTSRVNCSGYRGRRDCQCWCYDAGSIVNRAKVCSGLMMGKYILVLIAIVASTSAFPDVYRWVDASGQVHFADKTNFPRDAVQAEHVEIRPNVVTAPSSGFRQKRSRATAGVGMSPQRMKKQVSRDGFNEAKCHRAKQNLSRIRSTMRAGYKASEQARLHASELRYMEERQKFCD